MPRPRLRLRRGRTTPATEVGSAEQATGPATAKPPVEATTKPRSATIGPRPQPDQPERLEGLRAWLAQVDRKLGVRTYVGAAIAVLAAAAAAVALVLTLELRQDAATNDDVAALRDQLSSVQQSATQAAQSGVRSLTQRLDALESEVTRISSDGRATKRELKVVQGDIKELRSQVSGSGGQSTGGARSGVP